MNKTPPLIPKQYYQQKIEEQGYSAYLLASAPGGHDWSVAILDVLEAPEHFHKTGTEYFLVLNL